MHTDLFIRAEMAYKGTFRPRNPGKYKGNPSNIIYRSSWELKFMNWCDRDERVIWWESEEFFIPYRDPMNRKKVRRYFPDFKLKINTKDGTEVWVIEVKPLKEVEGPKPQKRKTKRYLNEVYTFAKNNAKWDAARKWCEDRKYKFHIFTEKELAIK